MSQTGPLTSDASHLMAQALKASMPSMQTQAQFTSFMAAFDALRLVCDSIFSADVERENKSREILTQALDAVRQATTLSKQFEELPAESRGTVANPFVNPPKEFKEYDIQKRLLGELKLVTTLGELNSWYIGTKEDRDKVVSQTLRNVLMDSIRERKSILERSGETI